MSELITKRSRKSGLPPGKTKITVLDYDETNFQEKEIEKMDECIQFRDRPTITWINVDSVHQPEILENIGKCFSFHTLVLEDILDTDQRPKIEDYNEYLYIVLKMLYYNEKKSEITTEQISLIVGPNYVISFQEGIEGDVFTHLRELIRNDRSRIRKMGADYLAYSLIDAIVDNYFTILEKIGDNIELLEEKLVENPTTNVMHEIHMLKREMIFLRKAVWPLREVISGMERGHALIQESTRIFLRDVYDHTIQVIDTVEIYRDMVSGMLDLYLSSISNRLNSVMKVLTIIATIFMPLTFIAGVYGMNFRYMPELEWRLGYPVILLVMLAISVMMLFFFRKKKWL
jgi:magnesium transporter